ncbi:FadR/GntR family transcriptional regulator [Sphingomonas sp. 22176]|uniref:FadR/GntR family transcriptional regulator n=1 Tax=Sphingomonas sp. 22176 TaxID=3453884 RepID=UPI003F84D826
MDDSEKWADDGVRVPTIHRVRAAIARKLGTGILRGKVKPGERLGGEIINSDTLKVSRSTYREVVKVLAAKGLVEARTRDGTRVLPRKRWNLLDQDVLIWASSGPVDLQLLFDLSELRKIIAPAAAQVAAQRRSRQDLQDLQAALMEMRRQPLASDAGRIAHRDFHRLIVLASKNEVFIALGPSIDAVIVGTTALGQHAQSLSIDPITDHNLVYEAVAKGNALEAGRAMQNLVDSAMAEIDFAGLRQLCVSER